jgi:lipopolysaccharide transport system ATP-binding protein
LFRIISKLSKPTHGRIITDGSVASILEIGTGFHPDLSGRENVSFNARLLGITQREIKGIFNDIIEFSGIQKFIDEPVKNYSAGMYLRLAFSILAHVDADIILLDEVMNVGDAEFQLKSGEKIRELIDRKNRYYNQS